MTLRFGSEQLERYSWHSLTWAGQVGRPSTRSIWTQEVEMHVSCPNADLKQEVVDRVGSSRKRSVVEIGDTFGDCWSMRKYLRQQNWIR